MVDVNVRMGGPARAKLIGITKIRWTWEWIQVEWWGRWTRRIFQHWSIPAAADHGETGGNEIDGKFGEPLLPLGGGW